MRLTMNQLKRVIRTAILQEAWSPERGFYHFEERIPQYVEAIMSALQSRRGRSPFDKIAKEVIKIVGEPGTPGGYDGHTMEAALESMETSGQITRRGQVYILV